MWRAAAGGLRSVAAAGASCPRPRCAGSQAGSAQGGRRGRDERRGGTRDARASRPHGGEAMQVLRQVVARMRGRGDKQMLTAAYELLRRLSDIEVHGHALGTEHYNYVLEFLLRTHRVGLGWGLLDRMAERGVAKNHVTYELVVGLHAKKKDAEGVRATLRSMKREGVEPTALCYQHLLAVSPPEHADAVLKAMATHGRTPSVAHYNTALRRQASPAAAAPILRRMKAQGLRPDVDTYGALLVACGDDAERAELVYDSMAAAGVRPRQSTYTTLASVYKNRGDYRGACGAIKRLTAAGHTPTAVEYGVLIKAIAKDAALPRGERLEQAELLFHQAEAAGAVSQLLHVRLMEVYQLLGERRRADTLVARLRAEGLELHPAVRSEYEKLAWREPGSSAVSDF